MINVRNKIKQLQNKVKTNNPLIFFISQNKENEWECIKNNEVIATGKTPLQVQNELENRYKNSTNTMNIFIDDVPTDD